MARFDFDYLPLRATTDCATTSQRLPPSFFRTIVHDLHNNVGIILALCSLAWHDEKILSERVTILWSLSYFIVDGLDSLLRQDGPFTFHALFCLGLGYANYTTPLAYSLRMNSKAALCELSSPFLRWSERTRKPIPFVCFALSFTACRILWVPFMMWQLLEGGMSWTDPRWLAMMGFYGLNWFWYLKIWRILVRGGPTEKKKDV